MWPIIFILLIPNALCDLKFDDIEQEIRASNDKNYVEYLKNKNAKAKKLKEQIEEHKKHKERVQERYKNSIQEQVKLRKSQKDFSKLEEQHDKQTMILLEKHEKSRKDYMKNKDKKSKEALLQSKSIKTDLKKNAHILEESTSKSYRVKKENRKY